MPKVVVGMKRESYWTTFPAPVVGVVVSSWQPT